MPRFPLHRPYCLHGPPYRGVLLYVNAAPLTARRPALSLSVIIYYFILDRLWAA